MVLTKLILHLFLAKLTVSREIIDLTWDFSNETIYWPDGEPFHYTKQVKNSDLGYWYSANDFCMAEHAGTHFDAPFHFSKAGWTVDQIPPSRLIANGVLIQVNGSDLTKQHLLNFVATHGEFLNNTVVLVKFGWAKFWPNPQKYFGYANSPTNTTTMNFPGISAEAAGFLSNCTGIVGVGVDTASLDPGSSTEFESHRILSKSSIYGLENVKLTDSAHLPVKGFTLIVSPLKLKGGSGSPVRILATIP